MNTVHSLFQIYIAMRRIIAYFLTYHTQRNNFISVNTISKNTEKLLVNKKTRRKLQGFHREHKKHNVRATKRKIPSNIF